MNTLSKKQTILITGGRSLLGRRLTEYLRGRGHRILWLTRDVSGGMDMCDETFFWDIDQNIVAEHPLKEADVIIHLAGASLFTERWSQRRKKEILRSRLRSSRVLLNALSKVDHHVHTIIYGSSTMIYGNSPLHETAHEEEPAGNNFLAQVFATLEHEAEVAQEKLGVRTAVLRNGFTLDPYAGVLPNLIRLVRFGLNTPLGSGDQYMNWIHQQDLCRAYEHVIAHEELSGTYNVVAPSDTTNSQFMYALCSLYGKDHIRLAIPSPFVKLILGEMGACLLSNRLASSDKLIASGFHYQYNELMKALRASTKD